MKTKHLRLMQRAYVILFFCFMYLPIAYMVVFSFNQSKGYALFTGFTLKWYTSLLHNESILHALWVSLYLALFSAVIATVLGTAASLGIASMGRKSRLLVTNITPKLKQLDIKLFEAALDLGCDPRQAFFKVILPEISPAILSGFLISLTYSIDDFMISYFNCGTVETLPIAIYSMTRKKVSTEIYALSTIMFVVILAIILISNAMESRSYRRDQKALRGEGV